MQSGTRILFHHPADQGVWYSPQTVLWYLIILGAPLVIVLTLKPLIHLGLDAVGRRKREPSPDGRTATANIVLADPGYRVTLLVFVYSLLLGYACGGTVFKFAIPRPHEGAAVINTTAGLPAAAALLMPLAIALFAASMAALASAAHYASAIPGTGLLPVIWLFAGGAGCLFAAGFAAIAGPYLSLCLVSAGTLLVALGFWRRQARRSDQSSVLERARRAEHASQRAQATAAASIAAPRGHYVGRSPRRYWGGILAYFIYPIAFFTIVLLVFERDSLDRRFLPLFIPFCLFAGLLFAGMAWLTTARHARLVTWDERGLEVTWYRGHAKTFAWDEVAALKVTQVDRGSEGVLVTSMTGDKFNLVEGAAGYPDLVAVLQTRVWARDEPKEPST